MNSPDASRDTVAELAETTAQFPTDKTDEYDVRTDRNRDGRRAKKRDLSSVADSLPPDLSSLVLKNKDEETRERLLTQLLFASRRVAERQIVFEEGMFHCLCCGAYAPTSAGRVRWHRESCAVGTVFALILGLQNVELNITQRKENAPKGDNDGAGDGLRPPVDYRTPWQLSEGIRTTQQGLTAAVTANGERVFDLAFHELNADDVIAFARRIVACVNTCFGMSTEALERLDAMRRAGSDQ